MHGTGPWNHFAGWRVLGAGVVSISKDTFEVQVLAMLGPLHGVARRLVKNDADAEDLVAEAITRAWRARASLVDEGAFRAWLFRILNNTFISERRKALARPREERLVDESADEAGAFSIFERVHQPVLLWFANPEQDFLDTLLREDLDRALAALPEHYRVAVVLADVEGLTYAEIAATLEVPVGTVRSRLARPQRAATDALERRQGARPADPGNGRHVGAPKGLPCLKSTTSAVRRPFGVSWSSSTASCPAPSVITWSDTSAGVAAVSHGWSSSAGSSSGWRRSWAMTYRRGHAIGFAISSRDSEGRTMAMWSGKKELVFKAVEEMYTDVASRPGAMFHFPTGRLACLFVGYPAAQLDRLPPEATESFAGVGYPFAADAIREGDTVLDIGSGSGTDTLIAAMLTGPNGLVYGLDMTRAMREKLESNVSAMQIGHVRVVEGNAEQIPLPDASIDVVTSNGVLNLVPDKPAAFGEIARVLKPGGRLQIADIALRVPVSEQSRANPQLWAECVVGAIVEEDYVSLLRAAGLDVEVFRDMDYFAGSANAATRRAAHGLGAHAILMRGCKTASRR